MVTWRSCIASSSALCTLAGARLISSASTKLEKIGPLMHAELGGARVVDLRTHQVGRQQVGRELDAGEVRVDCLGDRFDKQRLGQAGEHPSSSTWPSASRAINTRSTNSSWPTITLLISASRSCTR